MLCVCLCTVWCISSSNNINICVSKYFFCQHTDYSSLFRGRTNSPLLLLESHSVYAFAATSLLLSSYSHDQAGKIIPWLECSPFCFDISGCH